MIHRIQVSRHLLENRPGELRTCRKAESGLPRRSPEGEGGKAESGNATSEILDAHWGLESAPSPLNGERAEVGRPKEFRKVRFMGSPDLRVSDAHWGLEPDIRHS